VPGLPGRDVGQQLGQRAGVGVVDVPRDLGTDVPAVLVVELRADPLGTGGHRHAQRHQAGGTALVGEHDVHQVTVTAGSGNRRDRTQGRQQLGERMRADVPQGAVLLAPRGVRERAAGRRVRGVPPGGTAAQLMGADVGEPRLRDRHEAMGEEDDRADGIAIGGLDHPVRRGEVGGDRLLEQEVLAGLGCANGQLGLHLGRHREGQQVDLGQQGVEVVVRRGTVLLRQRPRLAEIAAPDAGELDIGVGHDTSGVHDLGPVSCADHSHAQFVSHWFTAPSGRGCLPRAQGGRLRPRRAR
jgi:hypothetical protein